MAQSIAESERLMLRKWESSDLDAAFRIWGNSNVMKFVNSGLPMVRDEVRSSLTRAEIALLKSGVQIWAVVQKESLKVIGACGFHALSPDSEKLELVFHFAEEYWGQGFATEAAKSAIEYAKNKFSPSEIIASTHPQNISSQRVLKKLGFISTGTQKFEDTDEEELIFRLR